MQQNENFAKQAEQAETEAERPEVVGYLATAEHPKHGQPHKAFNYFKDQHDAQVAHWRERGCTVTEDRLMTVSQHDRIVGALRAKADQLREALEWRKENQAGQRELLRSVTAERDAALARVAELERQEPVDVPGPDEIHQMAFEEGQPAEDGDGYLFSAEEFDLFVQRLLDSCATPVARAQHSVPEGWMLVECGIWTQEQVDEMQKTVARFRNSEFVDDRALAMAVADAGQCKAPEISLAELLAAAPGKEGV
ncbi:hypothetical protein I5F53_02960 [Pseudomonas aeruginosa]|nr:hypothetical protein [Pseudomonas aeruginosa]HDY5477653.1 hypothetical protein [Pseudomonas aeruginosa]HED8777279.1 hypothetical protein [Pseudomonas aeruginosa]